MSDNISHRTIDAFLQALAAWTERESSFSVMTWCRNVLGPRVLSHPSLSAKDRALLVALAMRLVSMPTGPCPRCDTQRALAPAPRSAHMPLGLRVCCSTGCSLHRGQTRVTYGTILEGIAYDKFIPWLLLYAAEYPTRVIDAELCLPEKQQRQWRQWLQRLFDWDLSSGPWEMRLIIGGLGIVVEIDESHISRSKPQSAPFRRARLAERRDAARVERWVWGAVERAGRAAGGQATVVLLDVDLDHPRGAPALREVLLRCVAPGSRIVHDDWGAYRALDWATLPFTHDVRSVVNHSKEIKNVFGEHTNHIEGVWSSLKRWLRFRCGGLLPSSVSSLEGFLLEWLWRQRYVGSSGQMARHMVQMIHEHSSFEAEMTLLPETMDSDTD